ncbi:hypothetical protein B0O99DRAFT_299483 [Bisporella sp. PMI_857]|nr:hypothetical protein B0O99DRAFT_299483 [Bisporella sp. PMI_857]
MPSFKLHHFLLDEVPNFCANSYAWRTNEEIGQILIKVKQFWIWVILCRILRDRISILKGIIDNHEILQSCLSPYIWIEAICINQLDFEERLRQILLIGWIYKRGAVAVCLDRTDKAVGRMAGREIPLADTAKSRRKGRDNGLRPVMGGVLSFLCQSWFMRISVIQEFILPSDENCRLLLNNYRLNSFSLWKVAIELFSLDPACLSISERIFTREGMKQYLSLAEVKVEATGRKG